MSPTARVHPVLPLTIWQDFVPVRIQHCSQLLVPGTSQYIHLYVHRLPKKQKLYDVEKELGRDSRSVFPSGAAAQDAVTPADAAKSLSAQRFVSETEVRAAEAVSMISLSMAASP